MNIIRAGMVLAVYLFIIMILYFLLSSPFESVFAGFYGLNIANAGTHVDDTVDTARLVFNMMFGLLAVFPVIWFFLWVFTREPYWGVQQ